MTQLIAEAVTFAQQAFRLGPITVQFVPGRRTALIGPSGAGKTTLLRCLAGLIRPTSGRISIDGHVVDGDGAWIPPHDRKIGYVFQSGALWPHMTALQHLKFAAPSLGEGAALDLLGRFGLRQRARNRPAQLSGGEGQRLALARALAQQPDILLLDEPLSSIDPDLRDDLARLIRDVSDDRHLTTVFVTHDRDEALSLGQHMVILVDGVLAEQGPAATLQTHPTTVFGASFLCDAACLSTVNAGGGAVDSAFGRMPRPDHMNGPLALVILPGEAALSDGEGASGTLLGIQRTALGTVARVEVSGRVLRVACPAQTAVPSTLRLQLRCPPRLLPMTVVAAAAP